MNRRKLEIKFVTELCNYNLGEMKILLDACVNYLCHVFVTGWEERRGNF